MKLELSNPTTLPSSATPGMVYYIPATIGGKDYMQMYIGKSDNSFQKVFTKEAVDEMIHQKMAGHFSIENGLRSEDNKIKMGGALTENTVISGADKRYEVTNTYQNNTAKIKIDNISAELEYDDGDGKKRSNIIANSNAATLSMLDTDGGDESSVSCLPNGKVSIAGDNMNAAENRVLTVQSDGTNEYKDVNDLIEWAEFSL